MTIPSNLSSGRITARYGLGFVDGPDPDDEPDLIPAAGSVRFTPSIPHLVNLTAKPAPLVVILAEVVGILDSEGYLCTPDPTDQSKAGTRGIRLFATDDPDSGVTGWTWTAIPRLSTPAGAPLPSAAPTKTFPLLSGTTMDLAAITSVPSSTGMGVDNSLALVAAAQAAAAEAVEIARRVEARAAIPGPAGKSAYEVAQGQGFTGTQAQWVASLRGAPGDASTVPGPVNTLSIGTVATGAAGTNAAATITGTAPRQTLNLTIPRGADAEPTPAVPTADPETARRDALVYGSYRPSADTVGTYGTLTDYNAPSTNTAEVPDGGLIENKVIYGDIKWRGSKTLTLRNCRLVGGTDVPTGASGVVDCNAAHTAPIILIDCTIAPREPRNRDGIVGSRWEAYRCDISRSVDGMGIFTTSGTAADVVAMGNWTHDLTYIFPDYKNGTSGAAWHTDGSHNDGAQLQGGRNVRLKGNYFDVQTSAPASTNTGANPSKPWLSTLNGNNGAGLTIQDNTGAGIDETVIIESNWFRGGLSQVNIKPDISFVMRNNKHFRSAAQNTTGSGGTWNPYFIRFDNKASNMVVGLDTNKWEDGVYANQALIEPRDKGMHSDIAA